jgi:serine/threonine-protein kinase
MNIARPVQTGDLVAGAYLVEHVLGQGGTGVVFAATDTQRNERVAIKVVRPELAARASVMQALRRQVQAAAAIRGEQVCRLLKLVEADGGVPCLVMEYLDGSDLTREALARKRCSVREAVGYVRETCAGLAAAHAAGVVHRDLKPSKLFVLGERGGSRRLKLLDFGAAGLLSTSSLPLLAAAGRLTDLQAALWVRAARYRAPEQLDSADLVDAQSNVWAVGAILYELLSGRPPFYETSPQRFVAAVRAGEPRRLRSLRTQMPEGLRRVVERALAKSRADRYASVTELSRDLAPYGSSSGRDGMSAGSVVPVEIP